MVERYAYRELFLGFCPEREGHCLDALFEAQGMRKPHTSHWYWCSVHVASPMWVLRTAIDNSDF